MKILSYEDEKDYTKKELIKYYSNLRETLAQIPYRNFTDEDIVKLENRSFNIKKILLDLFKRKLILTYDVKILGYENIPLTSNVIYASSHQDFYDVINSLYAYPEHVISLNAIDIRPIVKKLLDLSGAFYIDRDNEIINGKQKLSFKIDRKAMLSPKEAKLEMMKACAKKKSINIYPEATLNCSPNKLHLPFHPGFISIARKTGTPIVPFIQEYTYDDSILDGKTHVKSVTLVFGKPIYVDIFDNPYEKYEEFDEEFSTIRWKLIEQKGLFKRSNISNKLYTNFLKTRENDWKIPGNHMYEEREHVYGNKDEFYLFNYVNDVLFDKDDQLLETPYVRKLKKLYDDNKK